MSLAFGLDRLNSERFGSGGLFRARCAASVLMSRHQPVTSQFAVWRIACARRPQRGAVPRERLALHSGCPAPRRERCDRGVVACPSRRRRTGRCRRICEHDHDRAGRVRRRGCRRVPHHVVGRVPVACLSSAGGGSCQARDGRLQTLHAGDALCRPGGIWRRPHSCPAAAAALSFSTDAEATGRPRDATSGAEPGPGNSGNFAGRCRKFRTALECCEPYQLAGLQSGCLCRESKAAAHSQAWRRASAIAS